MGKWLARFRAPAVAAGLGFLLAASATLPLPAVAAAEKKPTVSEEVRKKLGPAQEAGTKGDYDTCIKGANEALATATKPYDKETSLTIMRWCLGKKGDFPGYADATEKLLDVETFQGEERTKSYKPLAQIFMQQKNYEKAEKYARLWADNGGGVEAYSLLVAVYYTQQNCPSTITAQEKADELDRAAGKEPTEQALRILNSCYYKTGDKEHRQAVMEELLRRFPKPDYFADVLQIYQEQNLDKRALLNLYRFAFDKDWISRESMFVEYADQALDAGAPAEALKVIDTATSKGAFKIIAQTDRNGRLMAAAKQQAADDKKLLPQLDKEARGKASGEADVKVGLAYMGFGEYDKAAEAIERGLTPDRVAKVKRLDDAQMMLGICYKKLGKTDEAKKAFSAAQGDPRMAKAATIWLQSL
ncbi:MAG TPA: tetratricopeptide repeat protein [Steroidobacteraceae bacterium]|nr:tetratricopeptide repeat protein [Steroidobacteraceae bacterium]